MWLFVPNEGVEPRHEMKKSLPVPCIELLKTRKNVSTRAEVRTVDQERRQAGIADRKRGDVPAAPPRAFPRVEFMM